MLETCVDMIMLYPIPLSHAYLIYSAMLSVSFAFSGLMWRTYIYHTLHEYDWFIKPFKAVLSLGTLKLLGSGGSVGKSDYVMTYLS